MNTRTCSCGKPMKFHDQESDEPIETDYDEIEGSFWYCSCGKIVPINKGEAQ